MDATRKVHKIESTASLFSAVSSAQSRKRRVAAYARVLYYSPNPYKRMIFEENLLLLLQTLDIIGITKELLDQLTIFDLLQLKATPEYKNFIIEYREVLNAAYLKQNNIIQSLRKKLLWKTRQERAALAFYRKLGFLQNCSSTIFLGLLVNHFSASTIDMPILVASGTTSVVTYILRRLSFFSRHMQTASFYNFTLMNLLERRVNLYRKCFNYLTDYTSN